MLRRDVSGFQFSDGTTVAFFRDIRWRSFEGKKPSLRKIENKIRVILIAVRLQVTNIADAMPLTVDHKIISRDGW